MSDGHGTAGFTDNDATALLAATAERLRIVRRAHERFLGLWAVDRLLDAPAAAARAWADVDAAAPVDVTPDNHVAAETGYRSLFWGDPADD